MRTQRKAWVITTPSSRHQGLLVCRRGWECNEKGCRECKNQELTYCAGECWKDIPQSCFIYNLFYVYHRWEGPWEIFSVAGFERVWLCRTVPPEGRLSIRSGGFRLAKVPWGSLRLLTKIFANGLGVQQWEVSKAVKSKTKWFQAVVHDSQLLLPLALTLLLYLQRYIISLHFCIRLPYCVR